jgi:hypothetical protein
MMTDEQRLNALKEYDKCRNEFARVCAEAQKAGKLHDRSVQEKLKSLNEKGAEIISSTLEW